MKTKTKSEIEKELVKLRQQIKKLEASDAERLKDRYTEQNNKAIAELENVLNTAPIHIAFIDINSKYVSWNRASENMFGFMAKEVIGKLTQRRFHRNDEEAKAVIETAEREGRFDDEVILCRKDGSEFPAHLLVTRTVDSSGNHIGFTMVAVDVTERKQAEAQRAVALESLRESEEQYRGIFESAGDTFLIFNPEGEIIEANPAACKMYGYPHEELIGLSGKDIVHLDYYHLFEDFKKQVKSAGLFFAESVDVRKDGSTFNIEVHGASYKYRGKPHLLAVVRDITERKRADKDLRESGERYKELWENAPVAYHTLDTKGIITRVNQTEAKMLGCIPEEMLGKPIFEFILPEQQAEARKRFRQKISGEHIPKAEDRIYLRKDGTKVYVAIDDVLERDGAGKVLGVRSTMIDITDRERAKKEHANLYAESQDARKSLLSILEDVTEKEQSLRESEEKLRTALEYSHYLVDSSLDMIISVDQERRIVEFNEAAQRTFGYNKEEVLGKSVDLLYANPEEGLKAHNTAKKTGQFSAEIMNKRKNGKLFPSFLSASILRDKKGKFLGVMGVSRDITELKRSKKEKEDLQAQLLQSQKIEAVGQLAGGVAHDFNNLLTIISGYSQLLLDRLDKNNPLRKNAEKIMKAGEQAASLTRQLLAFSRKQVLEPKVLNLNETIVNEQKLLKRLIGEDIKLEADLASNLKPVKVDPGQIEQVIMNLVVNARDAMPDGGKITVRTENVTLDKDVCKIISESLPGKFVRLSIEDKGVGIDKAIIDQIFEPFFTTKEAGVGTGLGLSVVYGIIKQHDGWINVYSEPGHGSTIKIYLPAVSEKIEDEIKDTISFKNLQGNGERILLVEDEEGIREFAATLLRENGYIVFEAANAQEALYLFKNEDGNFDLIFSDVVMPGKSGLQLVVELLSDKPDLRVLLSSGYSDKKSQWNEIKKKGFRFLQKPYNVVDLLKTIREVLEQK